MAAKNIVAFRICSSAFVRPHNGYGSTLRDGGRWNSTKCACIYSGSNRSIAQLEWISHSLVSPVDFPALTVITYSIPETEITEIDLTKHPDWISDEALTKSLGDQFLTDKKYMALKVPSAMDPMEFNYIINPNHPKFSEKDNVVNDTEVIILNKRFYEVKEFVKKALSMTLSGSTTAAKLSKYTSGTGKPTTVKRHRFGRGKR